MIRSGLIFLLATGVGVSPIRSDGSVPDRSPAVRLAAPNSPAAVSALRSEVERLIESVRWRGDQWSVTVVSLDRGDTLVSYEPDLALAPASNMKLFTTAAALYYLGPHYRYSTFLLTDGKIENGVLLGDLIVYGTGDPTFSDRFGQKRSVWDAFADTLAALGVREIRGNVIGDASYFANTGGAAGWQEDYMNASYAATPSALSFAENVATLQIKPGEVGMPPEVKLIPGGEGIALLNEATTVARGRSWIHVSRTSYDGPIQVRGQISKRTLGLLRSVPVSDPARYAAAVLRETLERRMIRVTGEISAVQSADQSPVSGRMVFAPAFSDQPPVRVLAIHESPPLIDILEVVNKKSHNLLAEQTLLTVGRVAVGVGSADGGARAVQHLLETESKGAPQLQMKDGSGLSVLNRVTTRSIVNLLSFMAKSPMWQDYYSTLPEVGARDGLRRMGRSPAVHNLRAKTGTIDHVSALSGYVRAANGERLAFSIISNNVPSTSRAKRIEDAIGVRLAQFDRATDAIAPAEPTIEAVDSAQRTAATITAAEAPAARATAARPVTRSAQTYTIRKGDTFESIAKRHGTTVRALQRANPGVSPRRLIPGRKIKLD
ncbi:MAG TPA: D-alanyl-D-alanine carboxypeptidase/D-alanyl-D-alanine-endopeptidase [Longimicrobiales bacterium]|nr:D-alanyl-D-alanine carboxypeptidase/D-alanyl-D-alanine-endopeptidase [Longimicrobiales bacterium]